MRQPDRLADFVLELLDPLGPVSARRMFGGVGLFHRGLMFGLIVREGLFLKVGEADVPAYETAGELPFSYQTSHGTHTIRSYWRCPLELLDDGERFRDWAHKAIEAAIAAARAKPKAPRRRPTRSSIGTQPER
ncbi:MAG: TfoX/Sxy family protein [Rhodopila sp.]